jgi:hypothetical protein
LCEAIGDDDTTLEPSALAKRIGVIALARAMRLAYSPLIEAIKQE